MSKPDGKFSLRCCWTCKHCILDIIRGYECHAVQASPTPFHLADKGDTAALHNDRSNCRAYVRG